jgi:hypothetical protein
MAHYLISYLDGQDETIQADGVEFDSDARDYTFHTNGHAVALAPAANVRSIVRQSDEDTVEVTA